MAAGQTNFLMEKGADFLKTLTLRDKVTKVPIDLTNSVIEFLVAGKQGGPEVFHLHVQSTDLVNGLVTLFYSKEELELVTLKDGWFVINITWSNGLTERLGEGRVVISKGVQ